MRIKRLAQLFKILLALFIFNDHLVQEEEEQGNVETSQSSLEANFLASFLDNDILVLVLFISMIEFWDLLKDPECLAIQLLLQVNRKDILEGVLLAH